MQWAPGKPKTGGRASGTPNKKTQLLREVLDALGLDLPQRLVELLPELDKPKQADVLLELMAYVYLKRKAIEHSGPEGQPIQVEESRNKMKAVIADPAAFAAALTLEKALDGKQSPESH